MALSRSFVEPDSISKHLHCSICAEVFTDPQRLPCEHLYCKPCILSWAQQRPNCPQCRHKFNPKKLTRDLLASNLVDELKVRCGSKGCCWVGPAVELPKHSEQCIFHPSREAPWVLPMIGDENTGPTLLSKLYERSPVSTKAFIATMKCKPAPSFFDFSDEENRSA